PYRDRVDSADSSNHGLPIGGQLPATDARATSPPLATHPYGTPVYAAEARAVPHFLESRIALPKYNPEPFGRKPVKIKTQNLQGVMFNGTNMEIGDFITRVERAAQLDGAQGSDICLQIVFFMQGEALAKEVQEMVERENYDWEKLKERFVQRWGSMMPLLKHTRAELDTFIAQAQAFGINTQRQFQDFSIKLENIVAYLLRCRQMTNVEDIRHAVLTCIARPIRIAVTKELIRDNQMQQAVDGSHILPPYRTIMEYIGRELKTMSILDIEDWSKEPPKAPANASRAPPIPQASQFPPKDRAMDDLTKTLAGWNVQRQPGFASASHVPYKPAQYERPPTSLKCHYCFGDGHTSYRCNAFSQDEFDKKVYREGKDYKLPNGTSIHFDRSRPVKAVVERFASMSRPPATPGVLNLPPGTQTQKSETPAEVQSSFGKLEECEPNRVASYEADMAKRLRGGKEIPDTPSAKKTRRDDEEDMDVDEDIMAIANKDYDPFPGYKEAQAEKENKKVQFKDDKKKKEKPTRKSFLEKALAKEYPEAEDRVVQRMVAEGRMELSYGEIFAISNGVTESFKKKISRKKVMIEPPTDKQTSTADVESDDASEDSSEEGEQAKRSHYACPLGYIKIGINGKEVQALLDNGSMVNVLPKEMAVRLGLIVTERSMNLKGIGGHKNEILGIAESVRVRIGNIKRSVHFWISSGDVQPILGKPFLIDVSASMKYVEAGGETLSINDDEGRTYLVPIITPSNQKWETSFPTNTTSTSNVVVAPEDHVFERRMQRDTAYLSYAARYKSAAKKIKPVNEAMPQNINKPLAFPTLSRDPYETPLTPFPPEFVPTPKITEERLKVVNFGPKDFLKTEELKLMKHVIVERQGAFAFGPEERGLLKHSYGEPYIIPVVPHSPWQQKPIPIAQAIRGKFIELVRERIRTGLYEQSCSSYSSPVFCVKKQDGNLRVVHDLQRLNKVTIKDAGLPPAPEDLIESFTGRACYGLGDIMGGYDERELSHVSRPLTTFETPLGRFQLTRLPQGATNSVAVYQSQMMWILQEEIPENVGIFIDDGGIKGPVSDYNQEVLPENPGIRRFIWEYAITLERVLFRIEEAGLTVSGKKFACCVPALELVGHVVCKNGRKISNKQLNKVESWPVPKNSTDVRGFLGVCVYVRMFIKDLSIIAAPLQRLTRKDAEWNWTDECQVAFEALKKIVGQDITLKKLDYSDGAGKIKLAVDSSCIAAGAVLTQEHEGKDRPVLYESVVFSPVESRYSQSKLELCGVAKILRKLQAQLWGQHFELLIDAKSLIEMINSPSLPNAPMTRWVAFIQLFSFDLRHVPGKTFTMPDGLSRRQPTDSESEGSDFDEDASWIKPHPGFGVKEVNTLNLGVEGSQFIQEGVWHLLQQYLTDMRRPEDCTDEEWKTIRHKSETFFLSDGKLKRRNKPFPQVVVSVHQSQRFILETLHEELGHRGVDETYRRCKLRFWWPNMKKNVTDWVKSCEACQKRSLLKPKELKHATGKSTVFGRVSMDAVHIKAGKWKYLLVARDDLSGWVEAVGLEKLTAAKVAAWFQENWIHRYGLPWTVAMDGGGEFGREVQDMLKKSGSIVKITTPYYPEANGMIERGHQPLKDALVKMCGNNGKKWREYLPLV
ncbi:hypothetical protein MJO28_017861, partial [Puccinia striiformis f. sp. tritici]